MATLSDIKYVIFGVRYKHSFKLLDDWGKIADDILKSPSFGTDFFPEISMQYTTERRLNNSDTGNVLTLSASNLVFKYYIENTIDFMQEYKIFCGRINDYLVNKILSPNSLIIKRIGVVFACELEKKDIDKFAKFYFNDNISGTTDFRFAQKEPTASGQYWKGTEDYINKIFTIGRIADNDTFNGVIYDFQLYYKPLQSDIRRLCPDFLQQGLNYFKKDILEKSKDEQK